MDPGSLADLAATRGADVSVAILLPLSSSLVPGFQRLREYVWELRAGEREIKERELERGLETERQRDTEKKKGQERRKVRGRRVKSRESEREKGRAGDELKRVGDSYSLQRNLEKGRGSWAEA